MYSLQTKQKAQHVCTFLAVMKHLDRPRFVKRWACPTRGQDGGDGISVKGLVALEKYLRRTFDKQRLISN